MNKLESFWFKMVFWSLSRTKKEDFMIRERILLFSSTNKWTRKRAKANVNSKIELTSFLIVSMLSIEKVFRKVSKPIVIFHPISKKTSHWCIKISGGQLKPQGYLEIVRAKTIAIIRIFQVKKMIKQKNPSKKED